MVNLFKSLALASLPMLAFAESNLRILPLGDSITYGLYSTEYNGYRLKLESMLQKAQYNVHYIVNAPHATENAMVNPEHEGRSGKKIAEIQSLGLTTFNGSEPPPNVVLLHAGSNDAIGGNKNPAIMIQDLAKLVDKIRCLNRDTTVVLAQIINNRDASIQKVQAEYNGYIPHLINDRVKRGYKLQGVNMGMLNLTQFSYASGAPDNHDTAHPSEQGFQSMATNWIAAIRAADQKGLISGPTPSGTFVANQKVGDVAGSDPSVPSPGTSLTTGTAPAAGVPTVNAC